VANGQVRDRDRHVRDAVEVVHAVFVRDVFRSAEDVDRRRVDRREHVLADVHPWNGAPAGVEHARVLQHHRLHTRVVRDLERLQAATAPARQRDHRRIDPAEEWAACAFVLGERPVYRVRQIGRLRARRLNLRRLSRLWRGTRLTRRRARAAQDASAGDHEIAVRGDLEQMQPRARAVVGTPAVAPRDDAQLRRTECAEIFRAIDDVRRQRHDFLFHRGKASGARRVRLIGVGARRLRGCDSGSEQESRNERTRQDVAAMMTRHARKYRTGAGAMRINL
jgi:hypothetical protein